MGRQGEPVAAPLAQTNGAHGACTKEASSARCQLRASFYCGLTFDSVPNATLADCNA